MVVIHKDKREKPNTKESKKDNLGKQCDHEKIGNNGKHTIGSKNTTNVINEFF